MQLARNELKPLDQREARQKAAVLSEFRAAGERKGAYLPDFGTLLSQARNGRAKLLLKSPIAEFPVDT